MLPVPGRVLVTYPVSPQSRPGLGARARGSRCRRLRCTWGDTSSLSVWELSGVTSGLRPTPAAEDSRSGLPRSARAGVSQHTGPGTQQGNAGEQGITQQGHWVKAARKASNNKQAKPPMATKGA